jgi:aryl-alcohol dehydrogenase-like predicted oxidoreductase
LGEKKERFARFDNERCWRTLAVVKEVAAEVSSTPAAVSLAWLLSKPQVTSAIFGARDLAQLESNVKASELSLSVEQLKRLDDASKLELGYPYGFMGDVQGRW